MKNYGEQLKNGLRKYKRIIAAFIIVFISVVVERFSEDVGTNENQLGVWF